MMSHSFGFRRVTGVLSLLSLAIITACSGGESQAEPTATATPLAGQRAPTALVPVPPTPVIGPTATGTAGSRPSETTTPDVKKSPTSTSTGSPSTTAPTPSATATATLQPTATLEPTASPLTIQSGEELVNEPLGVLQLKPGFGKAVQYSPGVNSPNFRVNVGFTNPFHPNFSPWNYGIRFRDNGQIFQMFVFDHEGNLSHIRGNGNILASVRTAAVPKMLVSGGASNRITFVVIEERAFALLDQELIAVFDIDPVGDSSEPAEVSLVADVFNQVQVVGAVTEFFDLTINSAGLVGVNESGTLIRTTPGEAALGNFSEPTSAGYAQVTLVSPINAFSGEYSFGLVFRNDSIGIDNWLVFDQRKEWRHIRRSTTGAESVFSSGRADSLMIGANDENLLEFVSTGQEHKIYLNGVLLTNMTLLPDDLPASIAPFAAFEANHQTGGLATEYRNFAVWSVSD